MVSVVGRAQDIEAGCPFGDHCDILFFFFCEQDRANWLVSLEEEEGDKRRRKTF